MVNDRAIPASEIPPTNREIVMAIVRPILGGVAMIAAYFVFPLGRNETGTTLWLAFGAVLLGLICAWEVRRIGRSERPLVTSIEMLVGVGTFYLVIFSTTYFLMSEYGNPAAFNEQLTRLDALYFSLTAFTTTGFGDIAPTSQPARALVSVQMISTFVLLGLGLRVLKVLVGRRTGGGSEG